MGEIIKIPLQPGGQLSDVIETDLGLMNYQEIVNLRLVRDREWEVPPGYVDLFSSLTNIVAMLEFTDDDSGDRFILFQDGAILYRITYDSGDGNGYENETATALTLPSGTTLAAADTVRFFPYRGIVRISGPSAPLWYGYISRTLFNGDDSFSIASWVLESAKIEHAAGTNDIAIHQSDAVHFEDSTAKTTGNIFFLKFAYKFDDSQFELLKEVDNQASPIKIFGFDNEFTPMRGAGANIVADGVSLRVRVTGSSLKSNMFNERITGVVLAVHNIVYGSTVQLYDNKTSVYYVPIALDFSRDLDDIGILVDKAEWDTSTPTVLEIDDPDAAGGGVFLRYEAGFLGPGVEITVYYQGSTVDTTVSTIAFGDGDTISSVLTVADSLASILGSTGTKTDVGIVVHRKWQYAVGTGYETYVGLDLAALGSTYEEFTGIPQATENIAPLFKFHHVIAGKAYALGMAGDEADSIRYSPDNQFDVFPIDNQIPVDVGDNDEIVNAAKYGDRLVVFKNKTGSQFGFIGSSYSEDINFIERGLYAIDSIVEIDNSLYFLDEDDAYIYNGNQVIPFFRETLLRKFYRENVTTSSFIAYNKLDAEIWFFLGTKILVWSMEKKKAYQRSTDLTAKLAFLSFSNELFVAGTKSGADKVVNFNHSLTTYDESLTWSMTAVEIDANDARWHKKFKELSSYLQSNGSIAVTLNLKDDDTTETASFDITAPSNLKNRVSTQVNGLFKELTVTVASKVAANNRTATIRKLEPTIEVWK